MKFIAYILYLFSAFTKFTIHQIYFFSFVIHQNHLFTFTFSLLSNVTFDLLTFPLGVPPDLQSGVKKCPNLFRLCGFVIRSKGVCFFFYRGITNPPLSIGRTFFNDGLQIRRDACRGQIRRDAWRKKLVIIEDRSWSSLKTKAGHH